jgi:hypothetical protein
VEEWGVSITIDRLLTIRLVSSDFGCYLNITMPTHC